MAAVPVYLSILFAIAFASVIVHGGWPENTTQPEIAIVRAPHHVIVEKKSPLLLNCSVVTSKTFGPLEFRWKKNGEFLDLDRRIQIFQNGSLFFRRIVHRKRRENRLSDEGLYECVAGNSKGRVVARRVRVEVAGIARNFTQEPTGVTAYVGGSARFDCSIKATPPAAIVWQKDNAQLAIDDHRFVLLPSGSLQIHNVSLLDRGSYRCMAAQNFNHLADQVTTLKWKWSREAMLRVLPDIVRDTRVLAAPHNTTAMGGETVILECLADGNPPPSIEWLRPDKALTDRHKIFGRGNLMIQNVKAEDAGIYQCFIKNGRYKQHHSAMLSVHTYPVMITDPESNDWPRTRTVSLFCEVEGNPRPNILWYFNGTLIHQVEKSKIKYELAEDNMKLIVYTVSMENAGYYQCVAENTIGQVFAIARIVVFAHKDAPPQPQNVTVTPISSTALMVEWTQQQAGLDILTFLITYRLREEEILKEQQKMVGGMVRAVNLTGLLPYTTYVVTIRSFTRKGSSIQSRSVEGRTLEGVPRAAPPFQVMSPSPDTMRVIWEEIDPNDRGGVITRYQLQYRPASNPSAITTHTIDDPSQRSFDVTGVTPDTKYELRLSAATKNGFPANLGDWSHFTTPKADVDGTGAPQLKVDVLNTSAVLLHWEWELLGIPSGRKDNYHIQAIELRRLGMEQNPVSLTVNPPQSNYILTGLENNTDYEVTVYASQQQIQVTHTFRISEGLLVPTASRVHGRAINPTTIRLEWTPSVRNHDIIEYQVCYREAGSSAPLQAQCMYSERPYAVISQLKAFTKYEFGVRIITDQEKHGAFTMLEAETTEDKPGPPVNLTYEVLKRGSVRLQWSPPSQPNGIITSYVIFYNMESQVPDTLWKNLTQSGQQTIAQVDNLDIKQYFFKMAACTKAGRGHPSNIVVVYPDCAAAQCGPEPQVKPGKEDGLTDKQVGIIIGISIGVTCIIICVVVILCRHRCFQMNHSSPATSNHHVTSAPIYQGNGHVPSGHGNGHAHTPLPGDQTLGVEMNALETMPMLTRLPENEMSDAKGGGDMIVTPNGVRMNGLVKTNGHLPNGHVTPARLDLSATSEERRSLIEAMMAATNGIPNHPACDPPLTCGNSDPDAEGDSLTAIDRWDNGETDAGHVLPSPPDSQGAVVLAGNVAVGPTLSGGPTSLPATHFAPFPRRAESGPARPHHRDRTGGGPPVQQGDSDRGQHESGRGLGRHNAGGGVQDCAQEEQRPPAYLHPQQGGVAGGTTEGGPPPSQHLRKSAAASASAASSPRQPATSQLGSPGHRYLATSPLPPPPPPPPPPSPPPSPPPRDSGASLCTGVGVRQEGGEREWREGGGGEGERESHREGGVTFPPQPSLPQSLSSSSSHQAAAAAASTTPAAAAARSGKPRETGQAPPTLSPPSSSSSTSTSTSTATATAKLQQQPLSHPQC